MFLGRVIGNYVSSHSYSTLERKRLLIIDCLDYNLKPTGKRIVAVDSVRAGYGETVMLVKSREAGIPFQKEEPLVPVDACIVGIIDSVILDGACDLCQDIMCPRAPGEKKDRCRYYKKAETKKKAAGKTEKKNAPVEDKGKPPQPEKRNGW